MDSIGQRLKKARENMGMSVSDVAKATLMQPYIISSLEQNDFDVLSAPIYVRGFIKMYAECVGINPTPLISAYNTEKSPDIRDKRGIKSKTPSPASYRTTKHHNRQSASNNKIAQIRFRLPNLHKLKTLQFKTRMVISRMRPLMRKLSAQSISRVKLPKPDIDALKKDTRERIQWLARKISKPAQFVRFKISPKTRLIIMHSVIVLVILIVGICGLRWHANVKRPRIFDARLIQPPPEPYILKTLQNENPVR